MRILVFTIISFLSLGISAQDMGATFSYSSNSGEDHVKSLQLQGKKLFVNGKEIVKYQLDLNIKEFKIILGKYPSETKECLHDIFSLKKKNGKTENIEKGCVGGKRFRSLIKAFTRLEQTTPLLKLR